MSDSLHGLHSPWNSPGQNTGVGSCYLLQGIFPTQGLNPGLPIAGRFFAIWGKESQGKNPLPQGKSKIYTVMYVNYFSIKLREKETCNKDISNKFLAKNLFLHEFMNPWGTIAYPGFTHIPSWEGGDQMVRLLGPPILPEKSPCSWLQTTCWAYLSEWDKLCF